MRIEQCSMSTQDMPVSLITGKLWVGPPIMWVAYTYRVGSGISVSGR
jgi:hypothetical protein